MGPTKSKNIQIHPTRRCNLRCLHCYSVSGPDQPDRLEAAVFEEALTDAAAEGYEVVSFSGGEPLLYKELKRLLHRAKSCGMVTTVTSNGILLDDARLEMLSGYTDVLAISLDGVPESHNRMRADPHAFERMVRRLEGVRASGIPFGFIFTLTQHNVHELEWAAQFAYEQGAKLFQVHPLEEVGRAETALAGCHPDEIERACAYLEAERIRYLYEKRMVVQVDLVHRDILQMYPDRFFDSIETYERPLSDLVSPLVIEADGTVIPFGYGFARRFALGSLLMKRLPELAASWRKANYPALRSLCRATYEEACITTDWPILNWWDILDKRAMQSEMVSISA